MRQDGYELALGREPDALVLQASFARQKFLISIPDSLHLGKRGT